MRTRLEPLCTHILDDPLHNRIQQRRVHPALAQPCQDGSLDALDQLSLGGAFRSAGRAAG